MIILYEINFEACMLLEVLATKTFHKKAPCVAKYIWLENFDVGNGGVDYFHISALSASATYKWIPARGPLWRTP